MRIENWLLLLLYVRSQAIAIRDIRYKNKKQTRIIEGEEANQADFPFIVSIIYNNKHICGGSIISPMFILTAAHCTYNSRGLPRELHMTEASVGSAEWQKGTKYPLVKRYAHERYNKAKTIFDIGLFKTETRIQFGRTVAPVKLNTRPFEDEDVECLVLGWGYTSDNGKLVKHASGILYFVKIYTISLESCKKTFKNVNEGNICLTAEGRKGSCSGDSGGPLVTIMDDEMVQVGLVSYGGDCNNTLPEVHTRISTFYDWILETTGKLQD